MRRTSFHLILVLALFPLAGCAHATRQPDTAAAQLSFGTSMAQRGLWQEALFRFREAERLDPQNPRVHNNLGVAYEAAGDYDEALKHYKRALEIAPTSREAKSNYARFVEFYQSFKGNKKAVAAGKGTEAFPAPKSQRGGTGDKGQKGPDEKPPARPPRPGLDPGAPPEPLPPTPPPPQGPRGVPQPPDSGAEPPPPTSPPPAAG
jgi:tetratricopeptide (TPR) repeat protein